MKTDKPLRLRVPTACVPFTKKRVNVFGVTLALAFCISSCVTAPNMQKQGMENRAVEKAEERIVPISDCEKTPAPEICSWSKKKLQSREQKIINGEIKKFEEIRQWDLEHARLQTTFSGSAEQLINDYCMKKFRAFREGRVRYFPKPWLKSSEIGYKELSKLRRKKALQDGYSGNNFSINSDIFNENHLEWFYTFSGNLIRVYLGIDVDCLRFNIKTEHEEWCCVPNRLIIEAFLDKGEKEIFMGNGITDMEKEEKRVGGFSEKAVAVAEIEGEFFVIESGIMIMNEEREDFWKDSIYYGLIDDYYVGMNLVPVGIEKYNGRWGQVSALRMQYRFSPTQQADFDKTGTWLGRMFALYPLKPAFREIDHQYQQTMSEGEEHIMFLDFNYQVCMWNIPDPKTDNTNNSN